MGREVTEENIKIGQRIRERRLKNNLSQGELGAAVGITFQQIQKYESGRNRVSAVTLLHLARALDSRIEYFLQDLQGYEEEINKELVKGDQ